MWEMYLEDFSASGLDSPQEFTRKSMRNGGDFEGEEFLLEDVEKEARRRANFRASF